MSDNTNSDGPTIPAQTATTAGALLKAARLSAGVHLAVLSANLKVPVRQLAALEADEYPTDQSPVFARGIAASVCRQLRVDPAPILALLPSSSNYLEPHGAVRYANTGPVDLGTLRRAPFEVPAKAVVAAVVMLVVIAALIWLPSPTQWTGLAGQPEAVAVLAPEASDNTNANANPDGPSSLPGAAVLSPSELSPAASDSAQSSVSTAVAAVPELVFSAQNVSWIEVRDAQKQLIWNGVLNAGETKRVPTALPVSVVVGRADAIQLSVKGQAFDLKPHTLVNTARFEVKP
jgi:cytoskeleton protein RodZ